MNVGLGGVQFVAPSRGRGLKLAKAALQHTQARRPFTGAWIETYHSAPPVR